MTAEKEYLVSLKESELILIASALALISEARSDIADQCLSEGRLRQARAHTATANKANNLGEHLFSLAYDAKEAE